MSLGSGGQDPRSVAAENAAPLEDGSSRPRISLVMATFNRRSLLPRAIESVRAQTFSDWEVVVVDDGSTDGTNALFDEGGAFSPANEQRVRFVRLPENRGVLAAKNAGFDAARGDFIATLDSDDEIVPEALERLFRPVREIDPLLDAVSCNCRDSRTGKFTGTGFDADQWIDVGASLTRAHGEHWGMFHRRILGSRRFNERLFGMEGVLWAKIHDGARWYYVHEALRIYHTEGSDRLTSRPLVSYLGDARLRSAFEVLIDDEKTYVERLRASAPHLYKRLLFNAGGQFALFGDSRRTREIQNALREAGDLWRAPLLGSVVLASPVVEAARRVLQRRSATHGKTSA